MGTRSERSSCRTRSASRPACGAEVRGISRAKSEPPMRASVMSAPPLASTSLRSRSADERSHWSVKARDRCRLIWARSRCRNIRMWPPVSAAWPVSAWRKWSMKYLRLGSRVTASRWISLSSDSMRAFCSCTVAAALRWASISASSTPAGSRGRGLSAPCGASGRARPRPFQPVLASSQRIRLAANSVQNTPAARVRPMTRTPPCHRVSRASRASACTVTVPRRRPSGPR